MNYSSEEHRAVLHSLRGSLEDYRLTSQSGREQAASCVVRMVEAWAEIHTNWSASDVGLGDTPEEVDKWQRALIAAGYGIRRLAELIVEVES